MTKRAAPVVLVSGGNRGIGFEACRAMLSAGATVVLGARKLADGERAAKELSKSGSAVPVALDVTDDKSVASARAKLLKDFGALDVMVNNAGVYLDEQNDALGVSEKTIERTLQTNLLGAWRLARAFAPAMIEKKRGRIVNVSSGLGAMSSMSGGNASYRVSKAALNALTLILSAELQPAGVSVISFCPGWVATDMGGKNAPRTPKSAGEALAAAALEDSRTGVFVRDGQVIPW
ncbi:MAG TPA: SDR family NAD(P)-dependent oxidoreductase [Elusimicrobiota bacterium]|nr:SDR family NAD(P)-dependent oxidoreductase [Elusimicrobiota bacterium]